MDISLSKQENTPVSCIETPCRQNSLDADSPLDADQPDHVTFDACWETNPPLFLNRMTDRHVQNINLLKTSFAGGNEHAKQTELYSFINIIRVMSSALQKHHSF